MKRQANIELLRGVLMFMIVMVHLTGNGVLDANNPIDYNHPNWLIANVIDAICYPAVNCFILVSGYFGLNLSIRKFLKLEIPVLIYGIILLFIIGPLSVKGFSNAFFPFLSKSYWFLTSYFILLLISPLINTYLSSLNKTQVHQVLLIAIGIIVLVPSFTPFRLSDSRGMDFVNFSVLYMVGRYVSSYGVNISLKKSSLIYIISSLMSLTFTVVFAYYWGINKGWKSVFYSYTHIFVYIQAIGLLFIFKHINIPPKVGDFVTKISPSFFFIYVIHESPFVHDRLYNWIQSEAFYYSDLFWIHTLGYALLIFLTCILIDIVFRRFIFSKFIEKIICYFDYKCGRLLQKV